MDVRWIMILSPIIGVDIGGSHAWAAQFGPAVYSCHEDTVATRKVNNKAEASDIFDTWCSAIASASEPTNRPVEYVGLSVPGPFDYRNGVGLYKGNDKYEALYGVNVKDALTERLPKISEFRFVNDAAGFGMGCALRHGVVNGRLVAVTLGTGFGATFVENSIPVTHGYGVPKGGELWCLPHEDGIADDFISTRWFKKVAMERLGREASGAEDVAVLAQQNERAQAIFIEFGTRLANILLPWLQQFKPDLLILGGKISLASSLFLPVLEEVLKDGGVKLNIYMEPNTEMLAAMGGAALFDEFIWARINDQ